MTRIACIVGFGMGVIVGFFIGVDYMEKGYGGKALMIRLTRTPDHILKAGMPEYMDTEGEPDYVVSPIKLGGVLHVVRYDRSHRDRGGSSKYPCEGANEMSGEAVDSGWLWCYTFTSCTEARAPWAKAENQRKLYRRLSLDGKQRGWHGDLGNITLGNRLGRNRA